MLKLNEYGDYGRESRMSMVEEGLGFRASSGFDYGVESSDYGNFDNS